MGRGELSAVCFRHRGATGMSEDGVNQFNAGVLQRTLRRGRVYISNATLSGRFCLRACIVNHRTKNADIDAVVPEVLAAAKEMAADGNVR